MKGVLMFRTVFACFLLCWLAGCSSASREDLDALNAKLAEAQATIEQVEQALPALEAGLHTAETLAQVAERHATQSGTTAAADAAADARALAQAQRERLDMARALIRQAKTTTATLQGTISNIEAGTPWWMLALQIVGGITIGATGVAVPMRGRLCTVWTALNETIAAIQDVRDDPQIPTDQLDVALGTQQSTTTKTIVKYAKAA
jgi:uncharacterized coiled-coil protein SlyX